MAGQNYCHTRGPVILPASQTILTQKHSFELMKTVITATFSHVLWARRVFPGITYDLRSYDPADPNVSYDSFIEGNKLRPLSFEPSENLMIWKILPRSQNPAVDKILNCLEIGAADALKHGYLSKLQLSLHSIDDEVINDSNLIESYTLIFEYEDGQDLRISSKFDVKSVAVRNAKQDLYGLVNDVGFLIHHNNRYRSSDVELPPQFRILLSLKYNEKAPVDYQPPMFHPGDENTMKILGSGLPNPNLTMMTGFHSVSVGIHISETEEISSVKQSSKRNSKIKFNNEEVTHHSEKSMALDSPLIDDLHTQPDAVRQLQKIGNYRDKNSDTQDTVMLDSSNSQRDEISLNFNNTAAKLNLFAYTQSVIDRVKLKLAKSIDSGKSHVHLDCECTLTAETESLLNCAICGNSKHARCYGYLNGEIPIKIICYSCLLIDDEEEHIEKIMKPLSIKRRALYYLREMEILTYSAELASHLNIPKNKVARLLGDLKAEGFVKGSRRDRKNSPMATYIGDDEKLQKLYFKPQKGIDHLLTRPELLIRPSGKYFCDKDTLKSSDEAEILPSPSQAAISENMPNNHQNEPAPTIHPTQACTTTVSDIKYTNNLHNVLKQTSFAGSSTQGTPSPGPATGKPLTYRVWNQLDLDKADEIALKKRSFAAMRSDSATKTELVKLPRTSKASPWLIRNY